MTNQRKIEHDTTYVYEDNDHLSILVTDSFPLSNSEQISAKLDSIDKSISLNNLASINLISQLDNFSKNHRTFSSEHMIELKLASFSYFCSTSPIHYQFESLSTLCTNSDLKSIIKSKHISFNSAPYFDLVRIIRNILIHYGKIEYKQSRNSNGEFSISIDPKSIAYRENYEFQEQPSFKVTEYLNKLIDLNEKICLKDLVLNNQELINKKHTDIHDFFVGNIV